MDPENPSGPHQVTCGDKKESCCHGIRNWCGVHFSFPCPSRVLDRRQNSCGESEQSAAWNFCGNTVYSFLLTRNVFAIVLALGFVLFQISVMFKLWEYSNDYVNEQAPCFGLAIGQGEASEGTSTGAYWIGVSVLLLKTLPEVAKGLQLILPCCSSCGRIFAGLSHIAIGVLTVVFGIWIGDRQVWGEPNDVRFILTAVAFAFIQELDEAGYSLMRYTCPIWLEKLIIDESTCRNCNKVQSGAQSTTETEEEIEEEYWC